MDFRRRQAPEDHVATIPLDAPPAWTPGCAPLVQIVNFKSHLLFEYSSRTAFVIDNLFSPSEIADLLGAAEKSTEPEGAWATAKVNVGGGREIENTQYRNSGRIILDSFDVVDGLLERMRPYIPTNVAEISGAKFHKRVSNRLWKEKLEEGGGVEPVAKLSRLNERLRFLRYGEGQFFQPHYDGQYWTPDKKEVSYYTLQIYLNQPGGACFLRLLSCIHRTDILCLPHYR